MITSTLDLARRAMACEGFAIMEGMPVVDDSGARGTVVALGPRWQHDPDWPAQNDDAIGEGLCIWRPGYGLTSTHGWLIDLSHPGAVGYLLTAAREAHDDEFLWAQPDNTNLGWWCDSTSGFVASTLFSTEIEALVNALEAGVIVHPISRRIGETA